MEAFDSRRYGFDAMPAKTQVLQSEDFAALMSLYFRSRHPDPSWLPEQYRPMPYERAVSILDSGESSSPAARRRTLRVATRLATGVQGRCREASLECIGVDPVSVGGGLETSEAPTPVPEAYKKSPITMEAMQQDAALWGALFPSKAAYPSQARLDVTASTIAEQLDMRTDCDRTFPNSKPHFDFVSGTASVTTSISVARPLEELAVVFDPQMWDRCSDFFVDTHAQSSPAPAPGSDWQGALFEHVQLTLLTSTFADFRVILDTKSTSLSNGRRIDYRLKDVLSAKLAGVAAFEGPGLSVDDGFAKIFVDPADPGRYRCDGLKAVKLHGWGATMDYWMTFWSAFGFWVLSDEIYDIVCCQPETT